MSLGCSGAGSGVRGDCREMGILLDTGFLVGDPHGLKMKSFEVVLQASTRRRRGYA